MKKTASRKCDIKKSDFARGFYGIFIRSDPSDGDDGGKPVRALEWQARGRGEPTTHIFFVLKARRKRMGTAAEQVCVPTETHAPTLIKVG